MRYADFIREDRRLVILRVLSELPRYSANSSVLYTALSQFGHYPSRDVVKTELVWLEELDLVKLEDVGPVIVATLTERGLDVAQGRCEVPGIKRPGA